MKTFKEFVGMQSINEVDKNKYKWTKPYYGVTHLDIKSPYYQFSVSDYGNNFVVANVINKKQYTKSISKTFTNVKDAKAYIEKRVEELL